ncbi:MAG: hypothetical protein NTZ61_01350, partial [Proteobacteria bacterium]|nr:hypothetical protein [Pseudomonadota bacterium]
VTETLFAPFNLIYLCVIATVSLLCVAALHPRRGAITLTPEQALALLPRPPEEPEAPATPAARIDAFSGWIWLALLLVAYPLGHAIATQGFGGAWNINAYNSLAICSRASPARRPFLRWSTSTRR